MKTLIIRGPDSRLNAIEFVNIQDVFRRIVSSTCYFEVTRETKMKIVIISQHFPSNLINIKHVRRWCVRTLLKLIRKTQSVLFRFMCQKNVDRKTFFFRFRRVMTAIIIIILEKNIYI